MSARTGDFLERGKSMEESSQQGPFSPRGRGGGRESEVRVRLRAGGTIPEKREESVPCTLEQIDGRQGGVKKRRSQQVNRAFREDLPEAHFPYPKKERKCFPLIRTTKEKEGQENKSEKGARSSLNERF